MGLDSVQFVRPAGDFENGLKREWLETNGLGGFASGTILGIHTRRYHGLLIAATQPPVGRALLLSKFDETLVVNGARYELGANQYPDVIHPRGFEYLSEFRLDPFPIFVYKVGGVELEKRVFMVQGENSTVVRYALRGPAGECRLEIRPLLAFRDFHALTHENAALDHNVKQSSGIASVQPYANLPALYFAHNAAAVRVFGEWYRNFEYAQEKARGLDFQEDLFQPFTLTFDFANSRTASVIASTTQRNAHDAAALESAEIERRSALRAKAPVNQPLVQDLCAAAEHFLAQRGSFKTVIAGYHWFSDWGRDTMIALPGLTLVTKRFEAARKILLAFAAAQNQGMLPNCFPDAGDAPLFNTVDATLWFFEAVRAYLEYTGDREFVRASIYPKLEEIIDWHLRGTRFEIRADQDGLLHCGEQLTWMDARVDGRSVTGRAGKPVEIQALWYNALRVMEKLSRDFDPESEGFYADLAARAMASFAEKFWNSAAGCLFDVVDGEARDASVRPNQIFAVSLRHSMLTEEQARAVVNVAQRDLLTPAGLRTLSKNDPQYRGRYEGGMAERDAAYHQGTVWPWLLGPFLSAYVKVHGRSTSSRAQAAQWLNGMREQMRVYGLGQVMEIADGDAPHEPRGAIAQAWSVGELLRAAVEDVFSP